MNTTWPELRKPFWTPGSRASWQNASPPGGKRSTGHPQENSLKTILIIKPGSFGDVIHALPCAAALRKFLPQTKITWLVDQRWQPLLAGNPSIDETIVFPREKFRGPAGLLAAIPWALQLGTIRPDAALDLQGLLRSALMAKFSRAQRIIGLNDAREGARFFYDQVTPVAAGEHSVRRCLRSLQTLGLPEVPDPEFFLPAGTRPPQAPPKPFVLLHPFARGIGKSLSPELTRKLCRALDPLTVVLAGTGSLRTEAPGNTIDLLGQTSINEIIWLIRAAAFVVSVDSGPMHIAAAVNPRLLSIHTWSDPRLVGPYNEKAWIWQGGEIRRQRFGGPQALPPRSPKDDDITRIASWIHEQMQS